MKARSHATALALALLAPACATVQTSSVRRESLSQEPLDERRPGALEATLSRDRVVVHVHAWRGGRCTHGTTVHGTEYTTTQTRLTPQSSGGVYTSAILGALGAALGTYMAVSPQAALCGGTSSGCTTGADGSLMPSSGLSFSDARTLGGVLIGAGVALLIPGVYYFFATGDATVDRPYTAVEGLTETPCEPLPATDGVIALRKSGGTVGSEIPGPALSLHGDADIDLRDRLPREATHGGQPWPGMDILVDGSVVGAVDLGPVRGYLAEEAWNDALSVGTPASLERFATDWPFDSHAEEVPARVTEARAAAVAVAGDRARRALWQAAGTDPALLTSLAAAQQHDAYEAAAICSLATLDTGLEAMTAARTRCATVIDHSVMEVRRAAPDVMQAASRSLAAVTSAIGRAQDDARRAAEQAAARQAEADAHALRRARAAGTAALARARAVIAACRSGSATGADAARGAYTALAAARGVAHRNVVQRLVVQIAAACRCTPTQAGVTSPQ